MFSRYVLFQFTHPGKGATLLLLVGCGVRVFQFTHPGKGATAKFAGMNTGINGFNSRTLGRVRQVANLNPGTRDGFNSRTLGRVRQEAWKVFHQESRVSIHAPWEGCDVLFTTSCIIWAGFNSRTLGRVRPDSWIGSLIPETFQFTHPGKGATRAFF